MIRTPQFSGAVGGDYTIKLEKGTLLFGADVELTSKVYFDAVNQFSQKGYALLNLSATWTSPNERWAASVIGRNVTNKYYVNYYDLVGTAILVNDGRPSTWRGTVSYKF